MARPGRTVSPSGRLGLIVLILISLGLMLSQRDDALDRRQSPQLPNDIQAPVTQWISAPLRSVETFFAEMGDRRKASDENIALRAELTSLRAETLRLQSLQFKLDRIESLLDVEIGAELDAKRIAARVVSDPSSPFVRSYLLGVGRNEGVRDGMPVLSDAGLVGHIVTTGRRSARVLRLDDLNSRVAVMSERSGARAILAGKNADVADLAFVSDADDWQEGDRVLTSGDDGRLPQGLPVGTVLNGARTTSLDFRHAPTDWVLIVPFTNVEPVSENSDISAEMETSMLDQADETSTAEGSQAAPVVRTEEAG